MLFIPHTAVTKSKRLVGQGMGRTPYGSMVIDNPSGILRLRANDALRRTNLSGASLRMTAIKRVFD
jgi:hypothetical protein